MLIGESRFHISPPRGFEPGTVVTGSKQVSPLDQWDMVRIMWDCRVYTNAYCRNINEQIQISQRKWRILSLGETGVDKLWIRRQSISLWWDQELVSERAWCSGLSSCSLCCLFSILVLCRSWSRAAAYKTLLSGQLGCGLAALAEEGGGPFLCWTFACRANSLIIWWCLENLHLLWEAD